MGDERLPALERLRRLHRDWEFEARKMRMDAQALISRAELLEVKHIDLSLAIDEAERALRASGGPDDTE